MQKTKAKAKTIWEQVHNALPRKERRQKMEMIAAIIECSLATVYLKFRNQAGLRNYEKKLIAAAYGKKIQTMFPEKPVKALPL